MIFMFWFINIWLILFKIFGLFWWMCNKCFVLLLVGSDIFGKFIVDKVELLLEYFINLFVIFVLMFFWVFVVELLMCGVKIMLLNLCNGDLNGLLIDVGLIGNMLIVVLCKLFVFKWVVNVFKFMIVLRVVLIKIVFFFNWVMCFVFIKFLVEVFFGICKEIVL